MIRIINIEDTEADFELIKHHLKKAGLGDLLMIRVESALEFQEELKKELCDLVICDYNVPGFLPMDALSMLREFSQHIPFVVISGLVGEESVADMMNAGVEDFVLKTRPERLTVVVKRCLRELEVKLLEARSRAMAKKAFAAKEEMLAIVYHDIKNPLAAISLDAQLLGRLASKTPNDDVMKNIRLQSKRILRTVNRLKKLVEDLLVSNSNDPGGNEQKFSFTIHSEFHNPSFIINEVVDSFRPLIEQKKCKIKLEIEQTGSRAYFDKERIFQVLSNLLGNAIKFSPTGSEIIITLKENENRDTVFCIKDNGPGISAKDMDHIFDKFWTSGNGHGLGLFICKSIVEAHGGVLDVSSREGEGAMFSFNVPYKKEGQAFEMDLNIHHGKNQGYMKASKTIYIVESDEAMKESISWALEKEGFRVLAFNNGDKALEDIKHTAYPPDLIIVDVHQAQHDRQGFLLRVNETLRAEGFHNCPLILVTAAPKVEKKNIENEHVSAVLKSPLDMNQLITTVDTIIH